VVEEPIKDNPPSLSDTLRSIKGSLDDLVKQKELAKFPMPRRARVGRVKAKKNWVSIIYLRENNTALFLKAPINEGVVTVNNIPHVVRNEYIMMYKNRPFVIIPEWSTEPYNPRKDSMDAFKDGRSSMGWQTLAHYLESEKLTNKKKVSIGLIIIILIALGAAAYYYFGQGSAPALG